MSYEITNYLSFLKEWLSKYGMKCDIISDNKIQCNWIPLEPELFGDIYLFRGYAKISLNLPDFFTITINTLNDYVEYAITRVIRELILLEYSLLIESGALIPVEFEKGNDLVI